MNHQLGQGEVEDAVVERKAGAPLHLNPMYEFRLGEGLIGWIAHQAASICAEDAEQVLWLLTSFESFDSLYTDRGMSTDRAVDLLIDIAERALYAEAYERG